MNSKMHQGSLHTAKPAHWSSVLASHAASTELEQNLARESAAFNPKRRSCIWKQRILAPGQTDASETRPPGLRVRALLLCCNSRGGEGQGEGLREVVEVGMRFSGSLPLVLLCSVMV